MISIQIIYLIVQISAAQETPSKSPMQVMLEENTELVVNQYQVKIGDVTYRKIEADGKVYYFRALEREGEVPMALCQRPIGWKSEQKVEMTLKVYKEKLFFFSAIQEECSTRLKDEEGNSTIETNNRNYTHELNPIVGIHLPEKKDDSIKNKKIFLQLENMKPGLSGDVNWDDSLDKIFPF